MSRSKKIIAGSLVCLLLLMLCTRPENLPAPMLALPFVLFTLFLFVSAMRLLRWRGISRARSIRTAAICTALPVLVVLLQTLGQLTVRDFATIIALFAMAYFYLSRISKPLREQ